MATQALPETTPTPEEHRASRGVPQFTDQRLKDMILDLIATGTNSTRALLCTVCAHVDHRYRRAHYAKLAHATGGLKHRAKTPVLAKTERRWKKRVMGALAKHCRFGRIRAVGYDQWEIV